MQTQAPSTRLSLGTIWNNLKRADMENPCLFRDWTQPEFLSETIGRNALHAGLALTNAVLRFADQDSVITDVTGPMTCAIGAVWMLKGMGKAVINDVGRTVEKHREITSDKFKDPANTVGTDIVLGIKLLVQNGLAQTPIGALALLAWGLGDAYDVVDHVRRAGSATNPFRQTDAVPPGYRVLEPHEITRPTDLCVSRGFMGFGGLRWSPLGHGPGHGPVRQVVPMLLHSHQIIRRIES